MVRRVSLLATVVTLAFGAALVSAPAATAARSTAPTTLDPAFFGSGLSPLTLSTGNTLTFNTETGEIDENGTTVVRSAGNDDVLNGIGVEEDAAGHGITAFYFASIDVASGATITTLGPAPLALLATGDVTIAGSVVVNGRGTTGGPGVGGAGMCTGAVPFSGTASGGGGGGYARAGGNGGQAGTTLGGLPGAAHGSADLLDASPFPVGSGGGKTAAPAQCDTIAAGGAGGGGVAIVSLATVDLSGGTVSAKGATPTTVPCTAGGGGGSGGSVLVVAPAYTDSPSTSYLLTGGIGGTATTCAHGPDGGGGGGGGGRLDARIGGTRQGAVNMTPPLGGPGADGGQSGLPGTAPSTLDSSFVGVAGPSSGVAGTTITFTASVAVGAVSSYSWHFGDGTGRVTTTGSVTHQFRHAGSYTVTATATMAASGTTSSASTVISVTDLPVGGLEAANDGPTADGATTTLTATHASGTGAISYRWDFGDGHIKQLGRNATTTHRYAAPGTYTATVTATNSAGPAMASTTVVVQDPVVSIADASIPEGTAPLPSGGHFTILHFALSLSAPTDQTVTFTATTSDGSAVAPRDYKAKTVTVTVTPGHRTAPFEVNVVPDARPEPDETFTVTLSDPTHATLGRASATGTIVNDD